MRTHKRPGDKTFNYIWGWAGTKFVPVQPLAGFSIPEGADVELWYSNRPPSALEVRSGKWGRPGGNLPLSELPRLPDRTLTVQLIVVPPFDPSKELH